MTEIEEILCKEIDAIILENAERLDKSIEHIKLTHDREYFTRYVCDEKDGIYSNGHFEPYKNHMRNCRRYEFMITFNGRIND